MTLMGNEHQTKTWRDNLLDKYPVLFSHRLDPGRKTPLTYGIRVGDGWRKILEELTEQIAVLDINHIIRVEQIKEKFGGLRYYISFSTKPDREFKDKVYEKIKDAENRSFETCEVCGNKGCLRYNNHWYKTLCDYCASKEGYKITMRTNEN